MKFRMSGGGGALLALATLLVLPAAVAAQRGVARLHAEAGAVEEIQAKEPLRVRAILVPEGSPAEKGRELVRFDTEALERYLEGKQVELFSIQRARRENRRESYVGEMEAEAAKEVANTQTRLAAVPIRAPGDGYVVRSLVAAGGKSKRRKPVLTFVELSRTRLTVTLEEEASLPVTLGETATVCSPDGRRRFRARIDSVDPTSGAGAVLGLTPLDLPFLHLDREQDVALQRQGAEAPVAIAAESVPAGESPGISDGGVSERIDVEVVNVDLVVVDRRGNRVADLSREEFELEVDGAPVAIEYFSAPVQSAPREGPEPGSGSQAAGLPVSAPAGRLLVFVDESALEGRTSTELLLGIETFLLERESRGDEVVLAAFTGVLRPLHSGSGDARSLAEALAELRNFGGRGNLRTQERARLEEDVRASGKYGLATPGSLQAQAVEQEIRRYEDEEILRQRRMVATLRRWVSTFAGAGGRKSLLLATSGLNAEPGAYLYDLLAVVGGAAPGTSARGLAGGATTGMRLLDEVDDLLRALHDARFVVYSVTPPEAPFASNSAQFGSLGAGVARTAPRDRSDTDAAFNLARLADETGGASLVINQALDEKIEGLRADAAASYSLGFSTGPEDGFEEHRIRVRVRRPGLEVRSRSEFRRRNPTELREDALTAAASLDVVESAMALELVAGDPLEVGKKGTVRKYPVTVRIPISALSFAERPGESTYEARIEVRFAVSRANGELRLGEASPVTIAIPASELEAARKDFWPHRVDVEVGAGDARVGVLVTDLASGAWSTASLAIAAP